ACGVARLSRDGFQVALAGPGEAIVVGNEIELRDGRLEVDSRSATVVIKTASGRATIPPRSRAEVDLRERASVRVAAYASANGVEWNGTQLTSGTEWRPSGIVEVESSLAQQADALLQGEAPACTPAVSESSPPRAPVARRPAAQREAALPPPVAPVI